jgi:hypothetical protein
MVCAPAAVLRSSVAANPARSREGIRPRDSKAGATLSPPSGPPPGAASSVISTGGVTGLVSICHACFGDELGRLQREASGGSGVVDGRDQLHHLGVASE